MISHSSILPRGFGRGYVTASCLLNDLLKKSLLGIVWFKIYQSPNSQKYQKLVNAGFQKQKRNINTFFGRAGDQFDRKIERLMLVHRRKFGFINTN